MEQLIIADGTRVRAVVQDVRNDYGWAQRSGIHRVSKQRRVWFHHTGAETPELALADQLAVLQRTADTAPFGCPYNFVVFPGAQGIIWYVNDVDEAWPHTYRHNHETAICLAGNFETQYPSADQVFSALRLAYALARMWGRDITAGFHCDVSSTACPGRHLKPYLALSVIPGA